MVVPAQYLSLAVDGPRSARLPIPSTATLPFILLVVTEDLSGSSLDIFRVIYIHILLDVNA